MKRFKLRSIKLPTKRHNVVVGTATNVNDLDFDDMFFEISNHWEQKAKKLQARRWRHLTRAIG